MNEFKVGDKVVRTGCSHPEHGIVTCGVYTIKDLLAGEENELGNVCLEEDPERYYDSNCFELYVPEPTDLEEAYAHIETLESALEDAVKRLDNWRNGRKESYGLEDEDGEVKLTENELQFKHISEYTLEDWELAKKHKYLFADNHGDESLLVENVTSREIYFDGYSYPFTVNGIHTKEPEEYQIIKRIK